MSVEVHIVEGPITRPSDFPIYAEGAGAVIAFEGVIRAQENGRVLEGLLYQIYEPMTSRTLKELCEYIARQYHLVGITLVHSVGLVRTVECSFLLRVASQHRAPGIAAMDELIRRMKAEIPIWKVPQYCSGSDAGITSGLLQEGEAATC